MNRFFMSVTAASTAVLCAGALFFSADSADMRDISTMALVKDMGLGINLGNTLESACNWDAENCWIGTSGGVTAYETAWGSPVITKPMIDGYKTAGFKTVRIPVAWSNLMAGNSAGGNYTINVELLNRVEEIVNYVLDNGMYAIVNIHWDGGWWKKFPADSAECMKKYTRIWTQIGDRFKDYDDYLMFESLNEEGVWNDVWYIWGDNRNDLVAKARAYGILNAINQAFTDLIRASGGNNAERHLLIAGYETNIDRTCDALFKMPNDPKNHCAVSVHYYDPFGFSHLNQSESWATMRETWGTAEDNNELNGSMNKLKTSFVDKGVPVIVGEYGFAAKMTATRNQAQVRNYTLKVAEAIYTRNMCPVLWDVQLNESNGEVIYYYNRHSSSFVDPQLVSGFQALASSNGTAVGGKSIYGKAGLMRPRITVAGKTLKVSSAAGADFQVRMIDVKGRVRASFKASGNGSFSLAGIPAGRYLAEAAGAGIRKASAAVVVVK
jgi:endoglucanase